MPKLITQVIENREKWFRKSNPRKGFASVVCLDCENRFYTDGPNQAPGVARLEKCPVCNNPDSVSYEDGPAIETGIKTLHCHFCGMQIIVSEDIPDGEIVACAKNHRAFIDRVKDDKIILTPVVSFSRVKGIEK